MGNHDDNEEHPLPEKVPQPAASALDGDGDGEDLRLNITPPVAGDDAVLWRCPEQDCGYTRRGDAFGPFGDAETCVQHPDRALARSDRA